MNMMEMMRGLCTLFKILVEFVILEKKKKFCELACIAARTSAKYIKEHSIELSSKNKWALNAVIVYCGTGEVISNLIDAVNNGVSKKQDL